MGVRAECRAERGEESPMTMRERSRVEAVSRLCAWSTGRDIEVSMMGAQRWVKQ